MKRPMAPSTDCRHRPAGARVLVVLGTRPEAVKLAPVIRALRALPQLTTTVCVSAQHRQMLDQVLATFDIVPQYDLDVMQPRQSLELLTARVLEGVSQVIEAEKPDVVLVQGDTTTAFAGSLAAFYRRVPVGHVEAGLRTGDPLNPFPEEMNRRLTGAIAAMHFAPTEAARQNLLREGVAPDGITVTGNTVIDALLDVVSRPWAPVDAPLQGLSGRLILVTTHRRESLGTPLHRICDAVSRLADAHPEDTFLLPVHLNPRVRETVFGLLSGRDNIRLVEPLDYVAFAHTMRRSHLILTDSGGIQEEAPSLNVPVLVLRDTTERPEAVQAGAALLVGTDAERIVREAERLLTDAESYRRMASAPNPFGDGHAGERIAQAIASRFGLSTTPLAAPFERRLNPVR